MLEQNSTGATYRTYQFVGLLLGPACFAALALSPAPSGLSAAGWATAGFAVWMAIWWATEALPLFVTALLPLVILPLLGIADVTAAAAPFANPVVFLLLGGFSSRSPCSAGICTGASPSTSSSASAIGRSI